MDLQTRVDDRVSSSISLILATSRPATSESWSKRSLRSTSYRGQCRRKCSLFSLSLPQRQTGLRQSKACLKRCSFRALKCTRSFVNSFTPEMSHILYVEFPCGLTISSNLCLNWNRDLEFLVSSSSKFHSNIAF